MTTRAPRDLDRPFPLPVAGRPRSRGVRAVTMLTIYLILLLAIPSGATISSLGSLGRPSLIWGIAMLLWWIIAKLQLRERIPHPVSQPVRFAFVAFLVVALVSFAVAMLRGQPDDQVSPAFTAVVRLLSWAGVLLITVDGVRDMSDVVLIVRRIGIGAGLLAALGILQFATRSSLTDFFASIPGITMAVADVASRNGVARVPGTAIHPLEYATVLNAALPLVIAAAISHGLRWQLTRGRSVPWIAVALISLSALIGVSRSAIIGFAVAVVSMIPVLPRRYRGFVVGGGVVLAAAAVIAVPGLFATTLNLFAGASNDPSTQSRTGGLDKAPEFIASSPIVGAGFGTFLPRYYIFDNAWILIAVELGVLGVIAFAAIFASAVWSGATARWHSTDPGIRLLGYALAASVVNIAVLFAFFDGLSFPQSGGLFFLIAGLCGVMRRISISGSAEPAVMSRAVEPPRPEQPARASAERVRPSIRASRQRATRARAPRRASSG